MDLNYLFHRHQIAWAKSLSAASMEARAAHRGLAAGYAKRINVLQRTNGAAAPFATA